MYPTFTASVEFHPMVTPKPTGSIAIFKDKKIVGFMDIYEMKKAVDKYESMMLEYESKFKK